MRRLVRSLSTRLYLVRKLAKICLHLEKLYERSRRDLVPIFFLAALSFSPFAVQCVAEAARALLPDSTCHVLVRITAGPTSIFLRDIAHSILSAWLSTIARLSSHPLFSKTLAMFVSDLRRRCPLNHL